jgi:response regulator RpfG family c-di-GMP phosphodiesterase
MPVDTSAVTLEFLLVSGESATQNAFQSALKEVGGAVECKNSTDSARDYISTHKVDSVILDVNIKSALEIITQMRRSKNARAFAFVCVKNDAESAVALKGGANAILTKPLSVSAISAHVSSFRSIIESERRRYRRHDVTFPALLIFNEQTYQGIVENLSQGGMAVRLPCVFPDSALVDFSFDLDSGASVEGTAHMRWANREGIMGMEFRSLSPESRNELTSWLRNQP